jgi:hypothetical protein
LLSILHLVHESRDRGLEAARINEIRERLGDVYEGAAGSRFPASPYPGQRPEGSFIVQNGLVWGLDPCGDGWVDRETADPVSIDGRRLVPAYGSNGNPEKLSDSAELQDLLAQVAERTADKAKRDKVVDLILTLPPIVQWPSEAFDQCGETYEYVCGQVCSEGFWEVARRATPWG